MISSVGRDAASTCASIRAGLAMPRDVQWFTVLDEESQTMKPLTGHPVRGYSEGFVALARWLRLAQGSVNSLLAEAGIPDGADIHFWTRTGLVFVSPTLDVARLEEAEENPEELKEAFLGHLHRLLRLPVKEKEMRMLDMGAAGAAFAIQQARQRIAHGDVDRVLVVAADSYLDTPSLEWLDEHGRLKTPQNPVGLVPGEAGACILVESTAAVARRGARAPALIEGAAIDREENHYFSGAPRAGAKLSHVVRTALSESTSSTSFEGDVIIDLNGESWRAAEWAHARTSCNDLFRSQMRLVLPCTSLGDIGAASAVLGVGVASRSFARGYGSGDRALVVSSSEHGHVGALVVKAGS